MFLQRPWRYYAAQEFAAVHPWWAYIVLKALNIWVWSAQSEILWQSFVRCPSVCQYVRLTPHWMLT